MCGMQTFFFFLCLCPPPQCAVPAGAGWVSAQALSLIFHLEPISLMGAGSRVGGGLKHLMDRAMKNDEQEALDAARGVTAAAAIGYGDSLPAAWRTVGRTDPVVDGL